MRHKYIFAIAAVIAGAAGGLVWAMNAAEPAQESGPNKLITRFRGPNVARWEPVTVGDAMACRVSPAITMAGSELNHHRVVVDYTGPGTVKVSVAHSGNGDRRKTLTSRHKRRRFQTAVSGKELKFTSPYKGERFAWILLNTTGEVTIRSVVHACWRGERTQYGHIGLSYEFGGAKLPYRLMLPKGYDPAKSYPLVVSVAGSGSVGTDNVKNMEMVILARHLFTKYYDKPEFACFSLVPQIPPAAAIPAPYHPAGAKGAPTQWHPDWPAVNSDGWFTQASLALIRQLIADPRLNIDADRVYYTGFSYGGKACWEFLKADPHLFAAALCGSGWPVGRAYSTPTGPMLGQLTREVDRYKDVPVWIFAGGADPMRYGSKVVHELILAAGGESTYTEFPKTKHISAAGKIWGASKHIAWLFQQSRPKPQAVETQADPAG